MVRLGDDIGAIWIATNPRTGSMWTTNVVREVVRAEGFEPLPENRSVMDNEIFEYGRRHVVEARAGVAVLKCHRPVPVLPRSAGIVTQRDVRDAFMSFMRFMRLSFPGALEYAIVALINIPERLFAGDRRLLLPYATITESPVEAVRAIAEFLGAKQAMFRSEEIASKFSKGAVKARIDAAEAEVKTRAEAGEKIERERLIILSPTNLRVRDLETDFQSGHVSDYRDGDWRKILTAGQQAQLNALVQAAGHSMV